MKQIFAIILLLSASNAVAEVESAEGDEAACANAISQFEQHVQAYDKLVGTWIITGEYFEQNQNDARLNADDVKYTREMALQRYNAELNIFAQMVIRNCKGVYNPIGAYYYEEYLEERR